MIVDIIKKENRHFYTRFSYNDLASYTSAYYDTCDNVAPFRLLIFADGTGGQWWLEGERNWYRCDPFETAILKRQLDIKESYDRDEQGTKP